MELKRASICRWKNCDGAKVRTKKWALIHLNDFAKCFGKYMRSAPWNEKLRDKWHAWRRCRGSTEWRVIITECRIDSNLFSLIHKHIVSSHFAVNYSLNEKRSLSSCYSPLPPPPVFVYLFTVFPCRATSSRGTKGNAGRIAKCKQSS